MTSLVGGEEPFRNLDTFTPPFSSPLLAAFVAVVEKSRSVPPSLGHNGPWFRTFGAILSVAILAKKNSHNGFFAVLSDTWCRSGKKP